MLKKAKMPPDTKYSWNLSNSPPEQFFRYAQVDITGKSVSEALILESVNPQYDNRLFIDLQLPREHSHMTSDFWVGR